jgi:hypothetical protein
VEDPPSNLICVKLTADPPPVPPVPPVPLDPLDPELPVVPKFGLIYGNPQEFVNPDPIKII